MAGNGRLPDSVLSPIAAGRLRKDAARAWNAMNAHSRLKYGVTIIPMGSMSSYRTYAQQVYLFRTSRPGWAAKPGTSNHGLGVAVDLRTQQMRSIVDKIGRPYGYAKAWSDASWEWWHIKYRPGVWKGKTVGDRTVRRGSSGPTVKKLQTLLRGKHVKGAPRPSGFFNLATSRAVKRFQKKHHLTADGIVGPATWKLLRR